MLRSESVLQDGLTGSAWGDWANYTASPLRAFENELGVQAPVGFWDPAGFTADGSVEDFKRRRQTELKHGRISMLATMGYITPEKLIGNDVSCREHVQSVLLAMRTLEATCLLSGFSDLMFPFQVCTMTCNITRVL